MCSVQRQAHVVMVTGCQAEDVMAREGGRTRSVVIIRLLHSGCKILLLMVANRALIPSLIPLPDRAIMLKGKCAVSLRWIV